MNRSFNPDFVALLLGIAFLACGCTASSPQNTLGVNLGGPGGGTGPNGNGEGYNGMMAYYQVPGYTCPGQTTPIGYPSSLTVNPDGSMTETDSCTQSVTPVDVSSVDNLNNTVLGYQDGIYQVMSAPPVSNPAQATFYAGWCWEKANAQSPGSSVGASVGFLVLETKTFSSSVSPNVPPSYQAQIYNRLQSVLTLGSLFNVQVAIANKTLMIDSGSASSPSLLASVPLNSVNLLLGVPFDIFAGEMSLDYGKTESPALCRLLQNSY